MLKILMNDVPVHFLQDHQIHDKASWLETSLLSLTETHIFPQNILLLAPHTWSNDSPIFYLFQIFIFVKVIKIGVYSSDQPICSSLETENSHWGLNPENWAHEGVLRNLIHFISPLRLCTYAPLHCLCGRAVYPFPHAFVFSYLL